VGNGPTRRLGWVGSKKHSGLGWVRLANGVFGLSWVGLKEFVALGEVGFGLGFSPLAGLGLSQEQVLVSPPRSASCRF
jgi:hypothetical protein